jgi:hypothetical protein
VALYCATQPQNKEALLAKVSLNQAKLKQRAIQNII